jgi:hypothetical protein
MVGLIGSGSLPEKGHDDRNGGLNPEVSIRRSRSTMERRLTPAAKASCYGKRA